MTLDGGSSWPAAVWLGSIKMPSRLMALLEKEVRRAATGQAPPADAMAAAHLLKRTNGAFAGDSIHDAVLHIFRACSGSHE